VHHEEQADEVRDVYQEEVVEVVGEQVDEVAEEFHGEQDEV